MNTTVKRILLSVLLLSAFAVSTVAEEPVYPVKVSENGRYFVDQKGNPIFWMGTTQWQIFRDYTLDEVRTTLENVKSKGFVFVQAMLMGVGDGTLPNVHGQKPWINDNPLTPNEAYFSNVDSVIQIARDNNVVLSITLYHQRYRKCITLENARQWAKWLANRYKDVPNIVWSMTPEATQEFVPILRQLAAGLQEGDGGCHLITFKPDPSPYSSSFIHDEDWLDFDSMQTWTWVKLIYPMVTNDYNLKPIKPVLMAEGAYEEGPEYEFDVTPLWVRRQAYYSYLAGAHHTYGHNDSWRVLPTWRKALDAPGACQLSILRKIFLGLKEWWYLVPDQSIFASGGKTDGVVLNLAARHKDGKWIMVYLASRASFSINMNKLAPGNKANAFWIDPKTGNSVPIGSFPNTGVVSFSTPNGWEDAVLILETSAGTPEAGWKNFNWPAGKKAAVSLTFDDARPSEIDNGLDILDRYGAKATFYVIPSRMEKRLAGWKKAVANGHEIGNHTLVHPCSGNYLGAREKALENYTLEIMEQELAEANAVIERMLGVRPTTFAYPCGQTFISRGTELKSYVPLITAKFAVGRGWGDKCLNDPAFCDLAQVYSIELDGLDFEQARNFIDRAVENGQWLIFCGHEVDRSGYQTIRTATLEAICKYANDHENKLWFDRVDVIGRYIAQQRQMP
jgi:peptidoglycan/xylan/chitin deacetylase (PgdA/CDA1 family)